MGHNDLVVLARPCLVLGSAPAPRLPSGDFDLVCVNSSGYGARALDLPRPVLTVLAGFKLLHPNREEDRQALRGLRTEILLLVHYLLPMTLKEIRELLARLDFSYERLVLVDFDERARVIEAVTGQPLGSNPAPEARVSNGVFATCQALYAGAPRVVVSGFSLTQGGHFYSTRARPRRHVDPDTAAFQAIYRRGWSVHTTETSIAEATGIPLNSER